MLLLAGVGAVWWRSTFCIAIISMTKNWWFTHWLCSLFWTPMIVVIFVGPNASVCFGETRHGSDSRNLTLLLAFRAGRRTDKKTSAVCRVLQNPTKHDKQVKIHLSLYSYHRSRLCKRDYFRWPPNLLGLSVQSYITLHHTESMDRHTGRSSGLSQPLLSLHCPGFVVSLKVPPVPHILSMWEAQCNALIIAIILPWSCSFTRNCITFRQQMS